MESQNQLLNHHVVTAVLQVRYMSMSWPAILLLYSLLSLSLPYAAFAGEEPIITGPKADPLFHDQGVFSSQHMAIGKILEYPEGL
jgi:hypothetical protein